MNTVLSSRLRELRGATSQSDFADKIGVKQTSYSSWERGIKDPAAQTVARIASTFGVSSDWLLGLSNSREGMGNAPVTPNLERLKDAATIVLTRSKDLETALKDLKAIL